jgi:hypothetical protein
MPAFLQLRRVIATYEAYAGANTRQSSTRKLGARLSPHLKALVDRFAKSRNVGFDHSVLSWPVPIMERMLKATEFAFAHEPPF